MKEGLNLNEVLKYLLMLVVKSDADKILKLQMLNVSEYIIQHDSKIKKKKELMDLVKQMKDKLMSES